jgi:hypothetical protein
VTADAHDVAIRKLVGRDAPPVDEAAVVAAEVAQHEAFRRAGLHRSVGARHLGMIEHEAALARLRKPP